MFFAIKTTKNIRGTTLIEFLIVSGVVMILGGIGVSTYINQQRFNVLRNTEREIKGYLYSSRQKAISQQEGLNWGIHFANPAGSNNDFYALFSGTSFSSARERASLSDFLEFSDPASASSTDIIFQRMTGRLIGGVDRSITIRIIGTNNIAIIAVSREGVISSGIMALERLPTPPAPPPPAPPAAPSGLSATAVSASQINLSWTDNSGDETGFQIERCTGAGCTGFGLVHTTAANATSWSDTGLVHSTLYRYRVRAINAVGNSSYSNIAEATTPPEGEYLLYVTAASFTGNLGGRSGADTRCNTDSNKPTACVSAGWALISVSETDEIQDMPTTRGVNTSFAWRWARGAARCVAATSWADLLDGTIANAATCVNYASSWIWTGSTFRGAVVGGNVCAGWIIGDTSARGQEGHTTSNDGGWLDVGNWNCSWQSPLYCACKAAI